MIVMEAGNDCDNQTDDLGALPRSFHDTESLDDMKTSNVTEETNVDIENQSPSEAKIINTPPDSVNDLSKSANKVLNGKDLTLHNIGDENLTLNSDVERDGPSMKPDRTPIRNKKMVLLEKLAEVLKQDSDDGRSSVLRSSLLDRLRSLHQSDSYQVLPSPDSSDGDEVQESSGVTGTLLSVIEEVEQQLELVDDNPESCVELILSRMESEAAALTRTADPCTDCQLCLNIVSPIHNLSVRVAHMSKKEKSGALISIWREIKMTMKDRVLLQDFTKMNDCRPCELCCDICFTYHEYVKNSSVDKRNQIREDFAGIIKKLDPQTQVVMNSSLGSDRQHIASNTPQRISSNTPQRISSNTPQPSPVAALAAKRRHGYSPVKDLTDDRTKSGDELNNHNMTSEFDSPTGESASSDNLDTSAGVNTIPYYETLSSKLSDCNASQSSSKPISEQMRQDLIMQINKVISKEVKSLKKDLTSRILGTLSPSLSFSDLRSIERAVVEPDFERDLRFSKETYGDGSPSELQKTNLPVFSVFPAKIKSQKPSKYDLLKQLPIAEENIKERKHCLLANMNKPPPKSKVTGLQSSKQTLASTQVTANIVIKETISSEDSPSVTVHDLPVISNSGLIHIQKKKGEIGKKHKIKVSVKARQRDNTLSNLTFPIDEEVSEITDIPPCLMETMDLSRQSDSESSSTSNTVQETRGRGSAEDATLGSEESHCCVCGNWEYDYEADISDHEDEMQLFREDLGSVSGKEVVDSEHEKEQKVYSSDDSGGRTDFTAYTAVIPKKLATKISPSSTNKSATPKKIKLDLPRSLTKNSPSTFQLRDHAKNDGTSSQGSCITNKSLGLIPPGKISKPPKNPQSDSGTSVKPLMKGNKKSKQSTQNVGLSHITTPKIKKQASQKSGKISNLSIPNISKNFQKVDIAIASKPKTGLKPNLGTSVTGKCHRKPANQSRIVKPSPSLSKLSKENSKSQLGVANRANSSLRHTSSIKKENVQTSFTLKGKKELLDKNARANLSGFYHKSATTHQVQTDLPKLKEIKTESKLLHKTSHPPLSKEIESKLLHKTSHPPLSKETESKLLHKTSYPPLAKVSSLKPQIVKPLPKTVTQKNTKIPKLPGPKAVKLDISHSTSTTPTPKRSMKSNLPTPVKKSSPNSVMNKTKPKASYLDKTRSTPEHRNDCHQKTSEKSNSKRSSSFDSGIASSRTKSFRVTQVVKNQISREAVVSKTPDSVAKQSSPSVSISFPTSRKLPTNS